MYNSLRPHGLRLLCPPPSPSLLKFMSFKSVMLPNNLILHCPHLLLSSIFPSIRVFSSESALHIRWPKYCSCSFNISPSNEQSGLISFRMDWLDLLAVQGTLKSLLLHYNSKASILWHSIFFMVQLSHLYMTTGKYYILNKSIAPGAMPDSPMKIPPHLCHSSNDPHCRWTG